MFRWLNTPYPYFFSVRRNILIAFACGLFVFLFLFVFKPFESEMQSCLLGYPEACLAYGAITTCCVLITLVIFPLIFKDFHSEDKWTLWKEVVSISTLLLLIATGNMIFAHSVVIDPSIEPELVERFGLSIRYTFAVGVFPLAIFILLNYNFHLKQNLIRASKYGDQGTSNNWESLNQKIQIDSDSVNESVIFNLSDLLFISASGNYCEFHLKNGDDYKKQLIRLPLQKAEDSLADFPFVFRTHRTYLVNLLAVSKYNGNAQGIQLYFDDIDSSVPVSRRRLPEFDKLMNGSNSALGTNSKISESVL